MSSVSRATFNALKSDLDTRMVVAVSSFAAERNLSYDGQAVRAQCGWVQDATVDILMFGMNTFPAEDGDDGGETLSSLAAPANDAGLRRALAIAASFVVAIVLSMWVVGGLDDVDAAGGLSRTFVHDATLPVTLSSDLLPDAAA